MDPAGEKRSAGGETTFSTCYDAPEAPVFHPTSKEFVDPGRYIASIADAVRPFGICKIVPPASWKPPFMLDKNKFRFRTKVQQVNYLDGQSRLRLTFVENLCRFLAKQGAPLGRLPVVNEKVLNLAKLFSEVRMRGGMISVTEQKRWSEVARALDLKSGHGGTLKQHYERILFCYELYKASEEEKKNGDCGTAASDQQTSPEDNSVSDNPALPATVKDEGQFGGDKLAANSQKNPFKEAGKADSSQSTGQVCSEHDPTLQSSAEGPPSSLEEVREENSVGQGAEEQEEKEKKAESIVAESAHAHEANTERKVPTEHKNDDEEDDECGFEFGYHDGSQYSLASYRAMAEEWKSKFFRKELGAISERDVEERYWTVMQTPEEMVEVEYGSELHSTTHGSGFPTNLHPLNPLNQPQSTSAYCRSPWNLNNLNGATLLRHIRQDISGILSPWVYVGMCMSSFCWHTEDHYLYSINYLWEGEPKQWYGCSGDDAVAFENAMRDYAPALFETQPDLLLQLVTMASPAELRARGVRVCRMTQRAGEFMLTFPRAYHGGYNVGYNVAESCNFALTDWIPWGRASDLQYRMLRRPQVFSHPGFLVNLAEDDEDVGTSLWLLPDLLRYYEEEAGRHEELRAKGLTMERAMDVKAGGVLTTALLEESDDTSNEFLDGKRVCAGRMQGMSLSMQQIRRAKQESALADECALCKASTFFFAVRCKCSADSIACVEHAEELCSCPLSDKAVEVRFSAHELAQLAAEVRERALQPSRWMDKARRLLTGAPQPCKAFQTAACEADKFDGAVPAVLPLQEQLRAEARSGRSWAARAQELLAAVDGSVKGPVHPTVDVSELEKLEQEGKSLRAVPEEKEAVEALAERVRGWRARAKELLSGDTDLDALADLQAQALALGVRMPEVKRLHAAVELKGWLHTARPLLASRARIEQVEELVREAQSKGLVAGEVQAMRQALEEANTMRFKLAKARERQTGLVVLRQLLDKAEEESGGMLVEIPEVEETKDRIRRCEAWSERAKLTLQEGPERPSLRDLEALSVEYSALGAHVEPYETLRSRLGEGTSWLKKTRKMVGDEMLAGARVSNGAGVAAAATPSATDGSDAATAVAQDELPRKRGGPAPGAGPAAKKAKRENVGPGSNRSRVSLAAVREQLEEEKKLRVLVPEAEALAQRVEQFVVWEQSVLAVVQRSAGTETLESLADLRAQGDDVGFELGSAGAALDKYIWDATVREALQAAERDGQRLATIQEEGRARGWEAADLDAALEEETKRAREKGCFCGRVGVNGRLCGPICCTECGKTFHPECLALRRGAAALPYRCAACQRKSRERTELQLPVGWQQVTDAAGRSAFVNTFSGQGMHDAPPGTTSRVLPGLLSFAENPCMSRGGSKGLCQVCFQDDTELAECAECGLRVHPSCYGAQVPVEAAAAWLCRSCEYGVRWPDCSLCPLIGGAAKPAMSGGWAHVVCATWVPEVFFGAPERMEPIGGVDAVPKDRRRIPCCVCKTRKGAIIQCGAPKCSVSWHPLCGMEAGMYMNLEEDADGNVLYVVRCDKHRPADEEDEDDTLYCLCQQRYVEGEFMIECEGCAGWFHPKCVQLSEEAAEQLEHWKCPLCLAPPPAPTEMTTTGTPHYQLPQPVLAVSHPSHLASSPTMPVAHAAGQNGGPSAPVLPVHPLASVPYALAGLAALASGVGSG